MIPSVGSGLTTTPTRQPHNAKGGGGGMALSACKPQRVPSSPAAAAAAEKKTKANNGDMTDSEALRRASQVSGVAIPFHRLSVARTRCKTVGGAGFSHPTGFLECSVMSPLCRFSVFQILIYICFLLSMQAPSAAAARRGSSGRPSCCPLLLFERASPSRWWAPQFDSRFLETQYGQSSFPRTTRKFQFGLMYLLGLCVMLAVYFPVTGTEKWPTYLGISNEGSSSPFSDSGKACACKCTKNERLDSVEMHLWVSCPALQRVSGFE